MMSLAKINKASFYSITIIKLKYTTIYYTTQSRVITIAGNQLFEINMKLYNPLLTRKLFSH